MELNLYTTVTFTVMGESLGLSAVGVQRAAPVNIAIIELVFTVIVGFTIFVSLCTSILSLHVAIYNIILLYILIQLRQ